MAPAPSLMTLDEYFRTPESVVPQELIYGVMRVSEAPTPKHQSAVRDIGFALQLHLQDHPLGEIWPSPVDVVLDRRRDLVVQPDLVFIATGRLDVVRDRIWGAPDLVIEVLSPHPRIGRLEERIDWFARYGVRECWLFHQHRHSLDLLTFSDRKISDRQLFEFDENIASAVLPDFQRSMSSILKDSPTLGADR